MGISRLAIAALVCAAFADGRQVDADGPSSSFGGAAC